jgi:hypothetical protein
MQYRSLPSHQSTRPSTSQQPTESRPAQPPGTLGTTAPAHSDTTGWACTTGARSTKKIIKNEDLLMLFHSRRSFGGDAIRALGIVVCARR